MIPFQLFPMIPILSLTLLVLSLKQHTESRQQLNSLTWCFVPIYNEVKSIKAGLNTIAEVMNLNKNIIVIATKLQKRKKTDVFKSWAKSDDFLNSQNAVHSQIGKSIPVLPLKFSAVFDAIFEQEKSIKQLMEASGLTKYQYREVSEQFEAIYNLIDTKYAK